MSGTLLRRYAATAVRVPISWSRSSSGLDTQTRHWIHWSMRTLIVTFEKRLKTPYSALSVRSVNANRRTSKRWTSVDHPSGTIWSNAWRYAFILSLYIFKFNCSCCYICHLIIQSVSFLMYQKSINKLLSFIIDNTITPDVEQQLHMYVKLKLFICTLTYFLICWWYLKFFWFNFQFIITSHILHFNICILLFDCLAIFYIKIFSNF